uniref:Uncharacterized protein n=1 Tax=viral metagenome TaxID=1070528 RepID=A0A6C0BCK0_9ZZZZ
MLGYFKGRRVFLKHIAIDQAYNVQLPYLCPISSGYGYNDFLQRKTDTGFVSQGLAISDPEIIKLLNAFKRSALKKLRNTL